MASHGVSRVERRQADTEEERNKELTKISEYRKLVALIAERTKAQDYGRETLKLTSKLLTWNPEYYTMWNTRRRIIIYLLSQTRCADGEEANDTESSSEQAIVDLLDDDLTFLLPLLRKFPKCYWIWNYRLWLLEQSSDRLSLAKARPFWEKELGLAGKMLSIDNRNFHGWGYRRTVVAALESPVMQKGGEIGSLNQQEFDYTTKMVNTKLSNFSAWHNRSKLIPRLLNEKEASRVERIGVLNQELELIERALWAGENDSSLWFYHQYLMFTFNPRYAERSFVPDLTEDERRKYAHQETAKLIDMLDGGEDCKWIYQALIPLTFLSGDPGGLELGQKRNVQLWVEVLKKLDPLRAGRWKDLEKSILEPPSN